MPLAHHSLVAWQRADNLFIHLHQFAKTFPSEERFELGSQMRRAAYSVPANIVEGFARRTLPDRARFLSVAWASLAEVGYCLHVAHRLDYIDDALNETLERELKMTAAPLAGLIRKR